MTQARSRAGAYAAVIAQTLISAGTYLAARRALAECPPLALATLRFVGASACFVALLAATSGLRLPPRKDRGRILLLAVLGVPLNQGLFLEGLARTTPLHASLMYTLTPAFTLLMSVAAGAERPQFRRIAGIVVALVGAGVVVMERGGDGDATAIGDVLVLGACIAWAGYTAFGQGIARENGAIAATSWSLVAGTLLFMPVGIPVTATTPLAQMSGGFWGVLGYLIVLTSVVAYLCWNYALRALEPSEVAIFTNLQPVATAALAWVLTSALPSTVTVIGGAIVIAGVATATIGKRRTVPA